MKPVSYTTIIKGAVKDIVIPPEQQMLVIRGMQRMRLGQHEPFQLEAVKQSIQQFCHDFQTGPCWLSDRAIQAIIDQCGDR